MVRVDFLGFLKVVHNGPCCGDALSQVLTSETGKGLDPQLFLEESFSPAFLKNIGRENFQAVKRKFRPGLKPLLFKEQQLRRSDPAQFVENVLPVFHFRDAEFARGKVQVGKTVRAVLSGDSRHVNIGFAVPLPFIDRRCGGDNPDHIPLDDSLARLRILDLFAHGHLASVFNELGHIGSGCMVGYAAHGNLFSVVGPPGCESNAQDTGCHPGVLEKHFVEITHAIEQDRVGIIAFDTHVLSEHGRQVAHVFSPGVSRGRPRAFFAPGGVGGPASVSAGFTGPMVSHCLHWGHCHCRSEDLYPHSEH